MIPSLARRGLSACALSVFLCATPLVHAAQTRLVPSDASVGARVGAATALSGGTLVVGAPDDHEAADFAGAAYVYVRRGHTWEKQAKLLGPVTSGFRAFGESVAISKHLIVVGAPFEGPDHDTSGAAYVYARTGSTWSLQARLTPTDSAANQQFGDAVAIDGDLIVVGATFDSANGLNAGAAYVFGRHGGQWVQRAKLTADDASPYGFFGAAVAIKGQTIVVGSPLAESAYVFRPAKKGWAQEALLTASDALIGDYSAFGAAVAIDDKTIAVGAPTEGMPAPRTGAVYVFKRQGLGWVEHAKVTAPDGQGDDEFGTAVALDQPRLAVGAPYAGQGNRGAIYLSSLRGGTWSSPVKETASSPTLSAFFGTSVALTADFLVGGAPAFVDYTGTQSPGAVFVFTLPRK